MNLEIWSIGKENESYIEEGIRIYSRRLKSMASVQMQIIRPAKKSSGNDRSSALLGEEELILSRLHHQDYLVLMDETGKLLDSLQWADQIQTFMNQGRRKVVFLIGGAYGVSRKVKERAHQIWSLSPLVFPHQLVRLLVHEQLYRSFSILHHLPYHHQ